MMNKYLTITGFLILTSCYANAESGQYYLQLNGGASLLKSRKAVAIYGFEAGYQFSDNLRGSFSWDYRKSYHQSTGLTYNTAFDPSAEYEAGAAARVRPRYAEGVKGGISAFMLNLYYDIVNISGFKPYVGVGAGVAHHSYHGFLRAHSHKTGDIRAGNIYKKQMHFAYRLSAGITKEISPSLSLDLRYQYSRLGGVYNPLGNPKNPKKINLNESTILVGLAYRFQTCADDMRIWHQVLGVTIMERLKETLTRSTCATYAMLY